jgi:nitronate monooxygenase
MSIRNRTAAFCDRFGLRVPILLAPMAGASAPALSIAVANAGGLGACGALLMAPPEIVVWANEVRAASNGRFQMNLWIPDSAPLRNAAQEQAVREFLGSWGPVVAADAGDARPPDFAAQCEALLEAGPPIVSSVMGLYPPDFVALLKARGISWFANTSTVAESKAAEGAGADVVVVQGMEAGGHRGCFDASKARRRWHWERVQYRWAPASCAHRKLRLTLHGRRRLPVRRRRTRGSAACSVGARVAALRPITCAPPVPTTRHHRHPTPCSAVSLPP